MGIELVTWNPRVNTTGDDRYNIPGATNLAGSVSAGDPRVWRGQGGSFSVPPTISEIDAVEGQAQINALIQRRKKFLTDSGNYFGAGIRIGADTFMTEATALDATDLAVPIDVLKLRARLGWLRFSDDTISPTNLTQIINWLRLTEGLTAFSFSSAQTALSPNPKKIKGDALASIRKSLAIETGTLTLRSTSQLWTCFTTGLQSVGYKKFAPGLACVANGASLYTTDLFAGNAAGTPYSTLMSFAVPDWLNNASLISSVTLRIYSRRVSGSPSVAVWLRNSTSPVLAVGNETETDVSLGSYSPAASYGYITTVTLTAAQVVACAGANLNLLFKEGTGSGTYASFWNGAGVASGGASADLTCIEVGIV